MDLEALVREVHWDVVGQRGGDVVGRVVGVRTEGLFGKRGVSGALGAFNWRVRRSEERSGKRKSRHRIQSRGYGPRGPRWRFPGRGGRDRGSPLLLSALQGR